MRGLGGGGDVLPPRPRFVDLLPKERSARDMGVSLNCAGSVRKHAQYGCNASIVFLIARIALALGKTAAPPFSGGGGTPSKVFAHAVADPEMVSSE